MTAVLLRATLTGGETAAMDNSIQRPAAEVTSIDWTPEMLSRLHAEFARLREVWRRLEVAKVLPPHKGSPADVECADPHSAYAHDLAATSLTAATDHLVTIERVFTTGNFAPTYAHFSMLRTAGECSWLAYWLLEPGTDAEVRLIRGIAAQCDDYTERKKLEDAISVPTSVRPGKSAADRLSEVMGEAEKRGLTKLNKNGKHVLITSLPSAVELFNLFQPARPGTKGEYLYRLLSGFAHGKQWALVQGVRPAAPLDEHGRTLGEIRPNPARSIAVTEHVVNAYEKAVGAFIQGRQWP